ncbi:MAG: outer membrane beta-barrel protein [Flavobacteriaceae bacterium]
MPLFDKTGIAAAGLACILTLPSAAQQAADPRVEGLRRESAWQDDTPRDDTLREGTEGDVTGSAAAANQQADRRNTEPSDALVEAYGRDYLDQNPLTATAAAPEQAETAAETAPPHQPEENPFEPIGIRVHGWTFRPSLESSLGYTDNVNATGVGPARRGSALWRLRPQLEFESGWSRHSLSGSVGLTHEEFRRPGVENRDGIDASLKGRLDIRRDLTLEGGLTYSRTQQSFSDPNVPATALKEPNVDSIATEASLTRRFGRFFVALLGSIERSIYESVPAQGGGIVDNSARDYTAYSEGLRLGYEISDRTSVFTDVSLNQTVHDRRIDGNGNLRGSDGYTAAVGAKLAGDVLTGEGRIGFRVADPDDPSFTRIRGFVAESSVTWQATPLTSVSLRASTDFEETVLAGTSTIRRHEVGIDMEHALRRNLILTASGGWTRSDYVGSARLINEFSASAGLEYKLNRQMALRGRYEFVSSQSTIAGESYDTSTVTIGVIVRR